MTDMKIDKNMNMDERIEAVINLLNKEESNKTLESCYTICSLCSMCLFSCDDSCPVKLLKESIHNKHGEELPF